MIFFDKGLADVIGMSKDEIQIVRPAGMPGDDLDLPVTGEQVLF